MKLRLRRLFVSEDVDIILEQFEKQEPKTMLDHKWTRVIEGVYNEARWIEKVLINRQKQRAMRFVKKAEAHDRLIAHLLGEDKDDDQRQAQWNPGFVQGNTPLFAPTQPNPSFLQPQQQTSTSTTCYPGSGLYGPGSWGQGNSTFGYFNDINSIQNNQNDNGDPDGIK